MNKTIHFISSLPRSGAVILYNVLAQNPRFHLTSQGGVLAALMQVRSRWNRMVTFRASPNEEGKVRVMRGMLEQYYADATEPVVFDRSLGWLSVIEMAELLLERKGKFLVCVRDVREILATLELGYRKNPKMKELVQKHPQGAKCKTVQDRADFFLLPDQPVGVAYNQIRDALHRGFADRLHFVEFEKLTTAPTETLDGVYQFLGEKKFDHDFENIIQMVWDNYPLYGAIERHNIPPKIKSLPTLWPKVLDKAADKYAEHRLW